ncbi:MAG: hypothetical protein ABIE74_06055, partial [Pseudomonadota bacterium]
TIANIPFRNIIAEFSEQPSWTGTKVHTVIDGSSLEIESGYLSGTYETPVRDLGYVSTVYIGIEAVITIATGRAFDDDSVTRFNTSDTLRFSGEESPGAATFEIKISDDNITWSGWMEYQAGDYNCRYYQIRMTLTRENVGDDLECTTFDHYGDLPDVDEYGSDTVTDAGTGKAVVFTKNYHEEPNVHIEITSGSGIYAQFTSKSTTGFTVKLYDASGVAQTGDLDWHGHGI